MTNTKMENIKNTAIITATIMKTKANIRKDLIMKLDTKKADIRRRVSRLPLETVQIIIFTNYPLCNL